MLMLLLRPFKYIEISFQTMLEPSLVTFVHGGGFSQGIVIANKGC